MATARQFDTRSNFKLRISDGLSTLCDVASGAEKRQRAGAVQKLRRIRMLTLSAPSAPHTLQSALDSQSQPTHYAASAFDHVLLMGRSRLIYESD
jgi:hypothetical protein